MVRKTIHNCWLLILLLASFSCGQTTLQADLLITNGEVYDGTSTEAWTPKSPKL